MPVWNFLTEIPPKSFDCKTSESRGEKGKEPPTYYVYYTHVSHQFLIHFTAELPSSRESHYQNRRGITFLLKLTILQNVFP